jgi:hypothetical protein
LNDSLSEFRFTVKGYGLENSCSKMKEYLISFDESYNMEYEDTLLKPVKHTGSALGNKK